MILNVKVANKIATYRKLDGSIVCGNSDYQIKFSFDEEWAEHNEKTARFIWNGHFEEKEFTGDTCEVPIIRNAEIVEVGVYAGNLKTTTSAFIPARRSVLCSRAIPTPENEQHYASEAKEAAARAEAAAEKAAHYVPKDGVDGKDGEDYIITDADKAEIVETVKTQVPLVKSAEQPTFVNSVDSMTDTSKVYVMPDMSMWAYMKGKESYRFTANDFTYCQTNADGSILSAYIRIATKELIPLTDGTLSIYCPEPYIYFIYFYSGNTESTYIGKTAWKSGNIDDVLKDVIASGTVSGAKYCRISLRDGNTNNTTSLDGRMDEFMTNIIVTKTSDAEVLEWRNTGFTYNQPADYEDRIVALENALEGIEYGSF